MKESDNNTLYLQPRSQVLSKELYGILLAFLGVLIFSWTLPASRFAAPEMGGLAVGVFRNLIGAAVALVVLLIAKEKFPARQHWKSIILATIGTVGFGTSVAIAMKDVPSAHGAVVIAVIPLTTALLAVLRARERPPLNFWIGIVIGCSTVVTFLISQNGGSLKLHPADLWLLAALVFSAFTYVEGAKVTRHMPGWKVVSWILVFTLPVILPASIYLLIQNPHILSLTPTAWGGLLYVALFSAYLGFFPWYHSFTLVGISRAGVIQLLQPLMTFVWGALFLGEQLTPAILIAGAVVLGSTVLCWKK